MHASITAGIMWSVERAGAVTNDGLGRWLSAIALTTMLVALVAIDARATYGARISVDEPQYLLTAISLAEDFDLDISDELAEQRFLPFHERERLSEQTYALNDSGQRLSPHDPLLPAILAAPMAIGGWVGARVIMAALAALTAAATLWVAVRRFEVPIRPAALVVGLCFASPPLVALGNQIYPAMPAALLVMVGVAVVTGDSRSLRRWWWLAVVAIVALPWLSVKYAPHAAVLAVALLWPVRTDRRAVAGIVGMLAVMGAAYLWFHQAVYGGWTVYAAGDHFVEGGEWQVVGSAFNPWGRTRRLIGLLVDRGFGLAAWAPVFLGAPAALTWLVARRRPHWPVVLGLVAMGWAVATWVALTMHGWWWPGRQVVPVVPLLVVAIAAAVASSKRAFAAVGIASIPAIVGWIWLAIEASTGRRTLIVDFQDTSWPWYRLWRLMLPDHQGFRLGDPLLTVAWTLAISASCVLVWRAVRVEAANDGDSPPSALVAASVSEPA